MPIENVGKPVEPCAPLTLALLTQIDDRLAQQAVIVSNLQKRLAVLEDQVANLAVK